MGAQQRGNERAARDAGQQAATSMGLLDTAVEIAPYALGGIVVAGGAYLIYRNW